MDIGFNKCGIAMASSGNINGGIQLINDVIDCKMLKGKYLVGMLSAHLGGTLCYVLHEMLSDAITDT